MTKTPKIFIFSHDPLSKTSSNGRTLSNLLTQFDKGSLYNFFIHGEPLRDAATFFQFSDNDALKSFFGVRKKIHKVSFGGEGSPIEQNAEPSYGKKTNLKVLLRERVWRTRRNLNLVTKLVDSIKPDAILLYVGGFSFYIDLAVAISKKLGIPLVTYNAEDYYFRSYDFVESRQRIGALHKLYKRQLQKSIKAAMSAAAFNVFLTEDLERLYKQEFGITKSSTIYNSSELSLTQTPEPNLAPTTTNFIFAGTIGLGRLEELEKIGKALNDLDPTFKVEVFTGTRDKDLLDRLNKSPFLLSRGFAPYEEILSLSRSAFAILHVDPTTGLMKEETKHGFTTKFPDAMFSGNCFIVRTSEDTSLANYIKKYKCAHLICEDKDLIPTLQKIIRDSAFRTKYISRALEVGKSLHSLNRNSGAFLEIIQRLLRVDG